MPTLDDNQPNSFAAEIARLDANRVKQFDRTRERWKDAPATLSREREVLTLTIAGLQVMQSWEEPVMDLMADACRGDDRVLEIGYGLGLCSAKIQSKCPSIHVIVEANGQVADRARSDLAAHIADGKVVVIQGFWEESIHCLEGFGPFDAIVFDAFPLSADEMRRNHFSFFPTAAKLLSSNGRFTYVSDEAITISTEHQAMIRQFFGDARLLLQPVAVRPPSNCEYWTAAHMLHVQLEAAGSPEAAA